MKRGDIVTVVVAGDYGKSRPAVVIQSDRLQETDSILVCLLTSKLRDAPIFRLTVHPLPQNGLKVESQIMVDKMMALPKTKCGSMIGRLDQGSLVVLNSMLSVVTGIAD